MDIDSLFKAPKLPLTSNKRKLPLGNPTPEILKRLRTEALPSDSAQNTTKNGSSGGGATRAVTVEDVEDDEGDDRSFAPGGDADYFVEEDEDGRFFGGGLTDEQKQILNIFDTAGEETAKDGAELDLPGIRRLLLQFDRAAKKNQDQRSKYPDDPTKFIDSEADLDAAIRSLFALAEVSLISYPELVSSGGLSKLIDLLSHENLDIVLEVIALLYEFTDEDVGEEGLEEEEEANRKSESLKLLTDTLLEHSTMELLVDNLTRMNEEEDLDRQGIYDTLGIFDHIIDFNSELADVFTAKAPILKWLLDRIQSKKHDENRSYSSELLAILLQSSKENRSRLDRLGGVDILLQVLSQFRKRDPIDSDEIEFMENVFDALCSALSEPGIKKAFLDGEGVELMVIMMREKKLSRSRSMKVLDFAMSGPAGSTNCERFVEVLGLKSLFPAFMQKGNSKAKSGMTPTSEDTSHALGILSSLFSNLVSDSPPRIRLLSKFVENDYEKVDRLLELREFHATRLAATDAEIESEKGAFIAEGQTDMAGNEDLWYLRRLDGGLFTLQTVDYILGWICMEDDGIRSHAGAMLERKNQSINGIVDTLKAYYSNIDASTEEVKDHDSPPLREILQGLIEFLDSC
ncbi:DUF1716-domain-containing protein [Cantharellus anzutake]|uniref:DUF1716-domain-containing protein n=1 Tax=Cantharellus anzutake TaxID=1750568 RepID=UPI0019042574|nr:DUF1716-domain-containing protein [Cantharellus anzutake]KAF8341535.1 DUF1716-domain-containing protein [Cantharellus anzutake]